MDITKGEIETALSRRQVSSFHEYVDADALKEAMHNANINQAQLSYLIGVSQPTISRWMRGKMRVTRDRLHLIADYLGIDDPGFLILKMDNAIRGALLRTFMDTLVSYDKEDPQSRKELRDSALRVAPYFILTESQKIENAIRLKQIVDDSSNQQDREAQEDALIATALENLRIKNAEGAIVNGAGS